MSGFVPLDSRRFIELPRLPLDGSVFLLLTAAGASSRFGGAKKELLPLDGKSILQRSLEAFLHIKSLAGILITYPATRLDEIRASIDGALNDRLADLPCGLRFVQGGATRQASVKNGLEALIGEGRAASMPLDDAVVLVHDAARPWVAADTIDAVLASARAHGACVPLSDLPDTPKMIAPGGFIATHPERASIKAAQTPQGFAPLPLAQAYEAAALEGWDCTDDSSLWDRYVGKVAFVPGDRKNRKITYREDMPMEEERPAFRIGEGWDIHPLVPGRKLLIGGIHIEHDRGEAGHSDGDVLWHAIIDALIGALGLGDIGSHFPPSDPRWKDADSGLLAAMVAEKVAEAGWDICNIDCTVILERPRLGPQREKICASIADRLSLAPGDVSVKAKTNEGFGEIGTGNAVEARAVALMVRKRR
ncbi:MAG TPA: 2-C-methyl-D-erythritol 2,4-cyclodiphosphate synthase [Rectinemataceae bacterium]|nr:2-C-methyl-D-erythritol 2,4-cyclodiphosphate synthase [Rectinemataceae bacterium]